MNLKAGLAVAIASLACLAAQPQTRPSVPPAEAGAKAALDLSARHGEWVDIAFPGGKVPVKSWVVYPEVKEKAPVVIVIHEIFGESD